MKNSVFIAATIDGYIADPDGGLEWLENIPNPEGSDYGYNEFINSIDAIVMGRKTFEKVLTFGNWPYDRKVFVLSSSLKSLPEKISGDAEIVSGNIQDVVSLLNERGFLNLYIDGGKTIQNFLKFDMIDEMIVTRVSIILGDGIPLFGRLDAPAAFTVMKSVRLNENLIQTHYSRKR